MTKFIVSVLVLLGLAVATSLNMSAQVLPGYISYRKGNLYDPEGNLMTEATVRRYIGDQIFHETFVGARRQYRTGKTLALVGIPVLVCGVTMFVVGLNLDDDFDYDSDDYCFPSMAAGGALIAGAGGALMDVGFPLWIIGHKRLKWVVNDYNSRETSFLDRPMGVRPRPYISTASSGLGLALNF